MYMIILLLWSDAFLLKSIKALLMESSAFMFICFDLLAVDDIPSLFERTYRSTIE